jgi:DNA-binding LacI/PurR family transcriptional regulator
VKILPYESQDRLLPDHVELLARLQEAGHTADFTKMSLHELGMQVARVARFVEKQSADAWVVCSASADILTWFSAREVPAMALYGSYTRKKIPIAGVSPRKSPALAQAVRKLVALGHRRIVMLAHEERRTPKPALYEQNFLNELESLGIPTSDYNLPSWVDTPKGLHDCLNNLFRHTPPTALILGDASFTLSVHQYLARRGIVVPDQLSLICSDPDPAFAWSHPAITHISWDYRPIIQRVLRWTDDLASGHNQRQQTLLLAEFIEGGTIAPPAISSSQTKSSFTTH